MSSVEEVFLLALVFEEEEKRQRIKRARFWIHPINLCRPIEGEFQTLFKKLLLDNARFSQYFRMSPEKYNELLDIIHNNIQLQNTRFRRCIPPIERLAVCLRYLTTGDTFKTIGSSYRLGYTTVKEIVNCTCEVICRKLLPLVMPKPTKEIWEESERQFNTFWNFPNCIGALDGKHVVIQAPKNSGSLYFNYKKTFSVVLLALVSADFKFIAVDIGSYGKNSDGGIFLRSALGKGLENNTLYVPDAKILPTMQEPLPHVIVGDEAFPLKRYLLRPYPRSSLLQDNNDRKKVFNYRLSRAHRVSENAFGILVQKFAIYQRWLRLKPENIKTVVLATCCLHNFCRSDTFKPSTNEAKPKGLNIIPNIGGNFGESALSIREEFTSYFNSAEGSVPWQIDMVSAGRQENINH